MSKAPQLSQSYSSPLVFIDTAAIAVSRPSLGRVLELVSGSRYEVGASDLGAGILLANGLYANILPDSSIISIFTTTNLISGTISGAATGDVVTTVGFATSGDSGGADWRKTGNVIAVSNTPTQTQNITCSDSLGFEYILVHDGVINIDQLGAGLGADDSGIFQGCETLANVAGSITFLGSPLKTYLLNVDIIITKSNVIFDFQGASLSGTSTVRITFDGDSGVDGDRSTALQYCAYKNVHITGSQRGPNMRWCDFPVISNVSRDNTEGTFVNMAYSTHGKIENIGCHNGDSSQNIGVLLLHCWECVVDNLLIDGGGYVYGLQVKGGYGNKIKNSTIKDISVLQLGFRDRGDAPWGASLTTGTYPYTTGEWGVADTKRASRGTIFENCWVMDCPTSISFITQESIGTTAIDCHAERGTAGFAANKLAGGSESGYKYIRCTSDGGTTRGFDISGESATNLLSGVELSGCTVTGHTSLDAARIILCDSPIIESPNICDNAGQIGLAITNSPYSRVLNPTICRNDQGILTAFSVAVDKFVSIIGGVVTANTTDNIKSWFPGIYTTLSGMPSVQSLETTIQQSFQRISLEDGKSYAIEVQMIGVGNSNRGLFTKTAVVSAAAGTAVLQATVDNHADVNPDSWGGLTFSASSDSIRVRVSGVAGDTIDWQVGQINCVEIPFI